MELQNQNLLQTKAYINGEWYDNGNLFEVINPFDGKNLADVTDCDQNDAKKAIEAASDAFKVWSHYSATKRSKYLQTWYRLIRENVKDLGKILTLEQGKPWKEAMGEIKYGASFVEWFAEEAKRVYGDVIPGQTNKNRITVIKQPVGVVGAITPWNFPNAMITRKISPALAAGCTVVIKPASATPLSALALAQLAEEAGFPPGVINILPSSHSSEIGKELCTNPSVQKISFTGSTEVGKILLRQAADDVKKVTMELGGNAPFIIFEDADLKEAAKSAVATKFRNTGQTCICTNRLFVHESIKEQFLEYLKEEVNNLNQGNGLEDNIDIGPLINEDAVASNMGLIDNAVENGGNVVLGGNKKEGLFIEPTILDNLNEDMEIFSTEIFGPIAAIYSFSNDEEVIKMANNTKFGLASYFFSRDYARIWKVAEALEYGMVGINTGNISTTLAPFGGVKQSGFGREGSKYGIDDYINIKYMNWYIT